MLPLYRDKMMVSLIGTFTTQNEEVYAYSLL